NGGRVTTSANQTYNDGVTLDSNTTLSGTNLIFNNIDGGSNNNNLTLEFSNNSTVSNNLSNIGDFVSRGQGTIVLNGEFITAGRQSYENTVVLNGSVSLNSNNNQIVFNGTVNGANNLNVNAGSSSINFNGAIGDTSPLNNLTASANTFNANNINASSISIATVNDISTGNLDTSSLEASGGNISLTSNNGAIATGNLNSSGISGGEIRVEAESEITTGAIDSSGSFGNGGNVTLDPTGDIQVTSINAQGGSNGSGGNVDITTERFFRATDTFRDQNGRNASISTAGSLGGGSIIIRHGGDGFVPFVVGDATTNGTAGTITSGEFNIEPKEFYFLTYREGNISLITLDGRTDLESERLRQEIKQEVIQPVPKLPVATIEEAQQILQAIEEETAKKPALIYISFVPTEYTASNQDFFAHSERTLTSDFESFLNVPERKTSLNLSFPPESDDELEILIIPPEGDAKRIRVPNIIRNEVFQEASLMYGEISTQPHQIFMPEDRSYYLEPASKMYQWLIAPIEAELQAKEIENLVFVMPAGLRAVPLAALYDDKTGKYLVQKYSVGLIPSINLVDTRYRNIQNSRVLALGAAEFRPDQDQIELPAVGIEVPLIVEERGGEFFLNNQFTFDNLVDSHEEFRFPIIHLATHADFQTGVPEEIYIQLFDRKLRLNEFRELGLKEPVIDLITISACRTAFGDLNAELGYGGLAVQTGAKSALASLWLISDTGTLALMSNFYNQLKVAPIKAEALRQTQIAMIENQLRIEGAQIITPTGNVPLPEDLIYENIDLSHPFYWSAFTMIGSPW
ncbi:MAG: CHAT domain-containing protein, partial [Prochloraceae cyanobacterium]|nr:CHAT domain-containing protein [Prochloraceae cyanobacterium]